MSKSSDNMHFPSGSIVKPVKDLITFQPDAQRSFARPAFEQMSKLIFTPPIKEFIEKDQLLLVVSSSIDTFSNVCSTMRFPPDGTDKEFLISNDLVFQVLSPEEFILRKD